MAVRILSGDCLALLPTLDAGSIDACVTDPPYHLTSGKRGGSGKASVNLNSPAGRARIGTGFMGKTWDGGDIAFRHETWAAVYRVLKPGAHLLAFGGTRTFHRLVCAIEDAGFEVRDTIGWLSGSGFPKSRDVSKAIDKAAGSGAYGDFKSERHAQNAALGRRINGVSIHSRAWMDAPEAVDRNAREWVPESDSARQWSGWGTALKPAMELICVARKPLSEKSVAANVLRYGTGAVNVDACRVEGIVESNPLVRNAQGYRSDGLANQGLTGTGRVSEGRWPANVVHDGSDEVEAAFAAYGRSKDSVHDRAGGCKFFMGGDKRESAVTGFADTGTASRFFYSSKADASDRAGSRHPTVKPTDLMRWLVRLVTPPGGTVLDPFCGTGSTLVAADQCQFNAIGIEQDATYAEDARRKFERDAGLFAEIAKS